MIIVVVAAAVVVVRVLGVFAFTNPAHLFFPLCSFSTHSAKTHAHRTAEMTQREASAAAEAALKRLRETLQAEREAQVRSMLEEKERAAALAVSAALRASVFIFSAGEERGSLCGCGKQKILFFFLSLDTFSPHHKTHTLYPYSGYLRRVIPATAVPRYRGTAG